MEGNNVNRSPSQSTIWCLLDGRPGHQNQVLGLAEALQQRCDVQICNVDINGTKQRLHTLTASAQTLSGVNSSPDVIIGAGHRSHLPLWLLRRRFHAKSIVLMKPTLPLSRFDVCLIPTVHNLQNPPANVILTKGVLNRIRPSNNKQPNTGICLIGGPSAHYEWSDQTVLQQLETVLTNTDRDWVVATSRRTPGSFLTVLRQLSADAKIVTPDQTDRNWLPEQLAKSEVAWVSEDSVSMMYEALTSGAAVGVIELQRKKDNRVTECTDSLVRDGDVTRWAAWNSSGNLPVPKHALCEAARCADEIVRRGLLPASQASENVAA